MMFQCVFLRVVLLICACLPSILTQMNSPGATSSFAPGGQYIMLTFDEGPHSSFTSQILDILKQKKVRASFFVVGQKAMHHPELLKRMVSEKHDVGNRGWTPQQSILKLDNNGLSKHIKSTSNIITNSTGQPVKFFRPHQGLTNAHLNAFVKDSEQLKVVLWSLDSKDLESKDPQKIADTVISKAKVGDVILMHDTSEATVQALPKIIDGLYTQGYEFLSLSQVTSYPDDSPHR